MRSSEANNLVEELLNHYLQTPML